MPDKHHDPEQPRLAVGLLAWALPPEKSGLSRAALEIAHAVADQGADVRVFTLDRTTRTREDGIEIVGCAIDPDGRLGMMRRFAGIGHLAAPLAFYRAVIREHRRRRFDVIEATNWYAPGGLIARWGPAPLVTRNSTPAAISLAQEASVRNRIDARAAVAIERAAARASAMLISNTAAHGATIAALYGTSPPGPGHAVIGLSLPAAITERGARADYPDDGPIELLFIGRNEPRKGFDALVDAIAILADKAARSAVPPFRFTLVGIGEDDVAGLPTAARDRVRLFHRVGEEVLHDLLAATHLVVAPSRYESFGLVYQEAMAFGRPVVACAEDASARVFVGESGAGVLAATCSGPDIANTIRPLLRDPALRARFAAASRAAGGRFTRRTLGEETIRAYRSAMASNGRSSRASSSGRAPSADIAP